MLTKITGPVREFCQEHQTQQQQYQLINTANINMPSAIKISAKAAADMWSHNVERGENSEPATADVLINNVEEGVSKVTAGSKVRLCLVL